MSARVGKQVKVIKAEDGKPRLVRKKGYASKGQHLKADRLAKAWQKGSKA
jgi:hypothetical protein